jgi:tRNA nucleotidyltransferase (CCA-adding enzyme)
MNATFKKAIPLIEKLKENGHEAYFVGGAVRDFLLHKDISDIDIATSALPEDVASLFPKTIHVGIEHGTVVVIEAEEHYEVTTFRTEGKYEDFRRPSEVTFVSSLIEDLKRRDFTVNAMAMTETGEIIDHFSGEKDLKNKVIRAVGDANERFQEDALRMMRAVRFMSQLGFSIANDTQLAIHHNAHLLEKIAIERTAIELEKLIGGAGISNAIDVFIRTSLIDHVPHLKKEWFVNKDFSSVQSIVEKWALLLCNLTEIEIEDCLKCWKRPNSVIGKVKKITTFYQEVCNKKRWPIDLLYLYGWDITKAVATLCYATGMTKEQDLVSKLHNQYNELPIKKREELVLTGNDLQQLYDQKPGAWIGELLEKVEYAVLHGTLENEIDIIKEWLMKCHHPLEKRY